MGLGHDQNWLLVEPSEEPGMRVLLAFEGEADAGLLVELLQAENIITNVCVAKFANIRKACPEEDSYRGIVPQSTLISPRMLGK